MTAYVFIALTIAFTVYGQLILKWQVGLDPALSLSGGKPWGLLIAIATNAWVVSAFAAAFAASLCWMTALSKLPLSKAYPFTALSFPVIALLSWWIFGESLGWQKVAGTGLVCAGILVLSRS